MKVMNKITKEPVDNVAITPDGKILIKNKDGTYEMYIGNDYLVIEGIPSRKQFHMFLETMKDIDLKMDQLNDVLSETCIDSILIFPTMKDTVLKYLKEVFHDDYDVLYPFTCDYEYGELGKDSSIMIDGKNVALKTIDNLYDFLIRNFK